MTEQTATRPTLSRSQDALQAEIVQKLLDDGQAMLACGTREGTDIGSGEAPNQSKPGQFDLP